MKIRKEAVILGVVIVALSLYLIFNEGDRSLYELPNLRPDSGFRDFKNSPGFFGRFDSV